MSDNVRLPHMQALRAFEAAARLASLTRAAAELHVTHGAISHQIKALEEDLGVELMARAGRGVRVTDVGERFAVRVREALERLADAVRETSASADARRIRVTVVPSFAARWLLPRIGRFVAAHPDVDLDVRAATAIVDFDREDVDFGIRHGLGEWPGVVAEHLFDETYFPVCSPRIANGRLPARPADLKRHVLLRGEGEPWVPWFRAAGLDWPEPGRGPSFSDSSHVVQAAAEGQGIALARESLLGNDLRTGALVRLFDVSVPSPRRFFLVYPPRLSHSGKLAMFRGWLTSELARDDALRAPRRGAPGRARRVRG
jgi:LysR family transcriptional regulator, glycine cleavage system transcriptional activator